MSGGHAHGLFVHGNSPVHRLAPECKIAGAFGFVLAVVATPRGALWAYALYAAMAFGVAHTARIPPGWVARRLVIEAPFVAFAVCLPLIATGPRTEVVGLSLSMEGLWSAWNILAKATLGTTATILLGATTETADLLRGLERLGMPRVVSAIAGFMVRYADVITGEVHRMRIARQCRGYSPGWLWQARAVAASAATTFIRSFERGERVYLAMVSRGYTGSVPAVAFEHTPSGHWVAALALPAAAATVATLAWVTLP